MTPDTNRLATIQKRNNLNTVHYDPTAVGPGNAYHDYQIRSAADPDTLVDEIHFQSGPRNVEGSRSGILDTDLLEIVRHRLECFQEGDYATKENEMALMHITEALLWLNKRVEDRAERGVLGTTNR